MSSGVIKNHCDHPFVLYSCIHTSAFTPQVVGSKLNSLFTQTVIQVLQHVIMVNLFLTGSEQSFQQLLPEFSSQEGSQHVDLPSIFSIEARDSFQSMENQNYSAQTELQNGKKSVPFQLSVGNLQNSGFRSSDEANVFHHLNLQHSTPCGSTSSECSIKAQPEGREETLGSKKRSERGIDTMLQSQGLNGDKKETCGVLNINSQVEEIDSQLCLRTVGMGTSVQAPYSVQNEKYFENSAKAETPEILRNLSQLAQSELFLSSGSLQSSIPMWVSEICVVWK